MKVPLNGACTQPEVSTVQCSENQEYNLIKGDTMFGIRMGTGSGQLQCRIWELYMMNNMQFPLIEFD